ncbi:MAG: dihydroorotase [Clostridia bacterium]|nr:dihydroorotase [Clostridia bacterium]MBO5316631.1 dihydroorotase [Clostridia bacterium]
MKALFRGALVYDNGVMKKLDMCFDGKSLTPYVGDLFSFDSSSVFDNTVIFPGFCDVHVHLREPGFSYKETIATGTAASARGGYTAVCSMPNLDPTPDSRENLDKQLEIIKRDAKIAVLPYGTITKKQVGREFSDMEDIAPDVVAFSDDGKGVQDENMMREAMLKSKALGKMIVAHCEDNSLLHGGYIHDGEYAKAHGHRGICSESEWGPIVRDIKLAEETGCAYHVCHISTKESVQAIREAKARGVNVTCETGPHYILLDDSCLQEDGRFKMNPPLRSPEDREAILEGILDGTIDMVATDHAPHSAEEKSRGLEKSAMGVVGIETAFATLYTDLVKTGMLPLEELCKLLSNNPRERFNITADPGFTVFEVGKEYEIDPEEFLSMGRATPFKGKRVYGKCLLTVYNGEAVYTNIG